MKSAIITGITGQDGSYMAELLLEKGYKVYGLVRRTSGQNMGRLQGIKDKIEILDADLLDQGSIMRAIDKAMPREFYNFAAQSFVAQSWNEPIHTAEVTGLGVIRCLEAIRQTDKRIRFYQASSSEMFGNASAEKFPDGITEECPLAPRSPYGCAKALGHFATKNYRESYGMFAVSGILFNHESPRRGVQFVTRKVTSTVARIARGLGGKLVVGNIDAGRDWGHAKDYMEAIFKMVAEAEDPKDYVVGTGRVRTVYDLIWVACQAAGIPVDFECSTDLLRPAEIHTLKANPAKAKKELGWEPKYTFEEMIQEMVREDLKIIDKEHATV